MLLPFIYWGGLYVAQFAGFVARSWYGVINLRKALLWPQPERQVGEAQPADWITG